MRQKPANHKPVHAPGEASEIIGTSPSRISAGSNSNPDKKSAGVDL
jgi:hypothetical protein